jgi:glycine cleavage system aminomethyltransferase T
VTQPVQRISPVQTALDPLQPHWGEIAGMATPLDFRESAAERSRASNLALCDVSALPRLTVKGPGAAGFLSKQDLTVPSEVYGVQPLAGGGLLVRTGGTEFFLEAGRQDEVVSRVAQELGRGGGGVYPVLRQDASFLLAGSRAVDVLAETCAVNFRETGPAFLMTRIAGVSTSVLPRALNGLPVYQIWMDYSYGLYLWEQLIAIVRAMEGGVAGATCFFPE